MATDQHHADRKDPNEIGALWTKQTKHGNDYYTGMVNSQRIVIFKNTKKRSEKSPDWRILKSEPQSSQVSQRPPQQRVSDPGEPPAWLNEGDDQW